MGWRSYAASAGRAPRSSPPSSPFAQLECACGGSVRRAWTWWLTRPRGRAMSACRKSGSARPARRRRRWRCTGSSCCSTMLGRLARGLRRFPSWAPFPEQSSALRSFDVRSRGPARRTWRCLGRPRRRGLVAQATAHLLLRRRLPRCPKSEAGQRAAPRLPLLRPQQRQPWSRPLAGLAFWAPRQPPPEKQVCCRLRHEPSSSWAAQTPPGPTSGAS
mmetsp:Transcript_15185/g.57288  ORF Transcript_15185/g.57288 Transcript_15185/m.57288 type:complete len:217 (-) Transcript_15185:3075-3725(-)